MAENKIELAKAYVQVIPTTEGIKGKLTEAMGTEGEKAGDKAGQGITSGIGKLIKSAALMGAVYKIGKKVGEVFTESIKDFADYQQLEGGVETLFGRTAEQTEELKKQMIEAGMSVMQVKEELRNMADGADVVMQNASNAFKNAGISANEYMDTVTSFSASLISSLGGDTMKAAEIADMAIIDMSDNANKMGTSMESIQNAYKGFAKGQFNMLDNLKLGYGGTKEEMQRLLEDAEKISGIKYDISSYADIVNAIHTIQDSMRISGSTADEAMGTISGSINMMKASWTDLLTGMSNPEADLGQLMSNFAESIKAVAQNLTPTIVQALKGGGELISGLTNMIIEMLPDFCKEVLPDLIKTAIDLAVDIVNGLLTAIPQLIDILVNDILTTENISHLISGLIQVTMSIIEHLPEIMLKLIEAIPTIIQSILDAFVENVPLWVEGFVLLVTTLVTKLPEIIFGLINAIPTVITSIVNTFTNPENLKKWKEIGTAAIDTIKKSFSELPGKLKEKFEESKKKWTECWDNIKEKCAPIIDNIRDKFKELKGKLKEVGKDIVKGLWNGINSKVDWIKDKISGWCKKIGQSIKDFFGIASPSKLMAEYGKYIDEGLATGIEDNSKIATNAMKELGEDALGGINVNGVVQSNVMAASATPSIASDRKLDQIEALLKKIAEGQDIYLDGNKLVGATANRMNAALDKISYSRERGVTNYAY